MTNSPYSLPHNCSRSYICIPVHAPFRGVLFVRPLRTRGTGSGLGHAKAGWLSTSFKPLGEWPLYITRNGAV